MSLSGWDANKKIQLVIDPTDISADLTDFPVLVALTNSSGKTGYDATAVFTELGTNSKKIAFEIGDTGNQCYAEIERWDSTNQTAQLHVNVPSVLAASGVTLNLYYDSTQVNNITYIGDTGDTAAQNVWDSNFVAVYHMAQDPSTGGACVLDSTANINHGTPNGSMTSGDLVDGLVGKALDFDGIDDFVDIGDIFNPTNYTLEATYKTVNTDVNESITLIADKYISFVECMLAFDGTDNFKMTSGFYNGTWYKDNTNLGNSNDDSWHYAAGNYDKVNIKSYLDNLTSSTACSATISTQSNPYRIGTRWDAETTGGWWNGAIGEVRISNIARSDAWIAATNKSLKDNLIVFSTASNKLISVLEQFYDLPHWIITKALDQEYSLSFSLLQSIEQIYGFKLASMLAQPYGDAPVIVRQFIQYYGDAASVRQALVQPYEDALQLRSTLDQPYSYPAALLSIMEQKYSISAVELRALSEQVYALKTVDLARAILDQPFALIDGSGQLLNYNTSVIAGDINLGITHINIEATRDQYCMSCEVHLATQADYVQCKVLDDLTITIDSEVFEFFIEAKQRQRGHATAEYTINGLSKTALLDAPYADNVTEDLSGMASAIVADLAPDYTINWQTVDWYIPANTLMPADQTPLQIIRQIASAAGAIIQTEPNGMLTIEPAYPIAVPNWSTATVQHGLSDALDFFSTGETFDHRSGYNRYLVSDQLTSDNTLRLEEEAITNNKKYIRAYQTPWQDDFDLRQTGGDWVSVEPLGIDERLIEDEVVEFVNGIGNTSYPIYERVSVEWLRADLGSIVFGEDGKLQSSVDGESLLRISYRTKCRKYLVTDAKTEPVQLVAEEVS